MKYIYNPANHRRSGTTTQKEKARGTRYYRLRTVAPGFPLDMKFSSREEIEAYISGDRIQCLLCGRLFKALTQWHLVQIHGITREDYCKKYNLFAGTPLATKALREQQSQNNKENPRWEHMLKFANQQHGNYNNYRPDFAMAELAARAPEAAKISANKFRTPVEKIQEIEDLRKQGMSCTEACKMAGVGPTSYKRMRKKYAKMESLL